MGTLPTGTVTFLFTDIERSTQSATTLGDERYARLLETHRKLLQDAFIPRNGVEVRTEGDALFVAFARVAEAAAAAVAGQRALAEHKWPKGTQIRVRMGLHTGDALVRGDDYVGQDVHKAKRICDAGHGGQILLSDASAALLTSHLPEDAALIDLGPHRLKDLGGPQHLYQLTAPDLPADFPMLRSLESFTHNLPFQRSVFIGREQEIADVRKLLENHRIVTLTGVGGTGKTRLALQIGAEELDWYPDGVFFAELATLTEPELIPRTVADAVGMIIGGGIAGGTPMPVADLVVDHLVRRRCLLILDNCEHLLDGCAELADRILTKCPSVTILVTSREPLGLDGEQSWRVPSLTVPTDPSEVEHSEAVNLFVARAKALQPQFELTDHNVEAVAAICARLDGLPLAIELAASRVTHLAPQQIADRLDDMFRLLTGSRRRVQRQQTLEASLDWSHELLDTAERTLLRRLAVFSGSFDLRAAEEVCAKGEVASTSVIDLLRSLVAKSLVLAEEYGPEVRYRMLEPVRLYAAEHLRRATESEAFRERHRDRYLGWLESFPSDEATFGFAAFAAFEREHDNLRTAIEWSAADGRYDFVALMANRLLTLWWNGGYTDEGMRWLSACIENASISGEELAAAYAGLTACAVLRVDGRAQEYAEKAIAAAGGLPAHRSLALALGSIFSGVVAEMSRDEALAKQAREWTAKAVSAGSEAGPAWKAFALVVAGQVELILRDIAAADRHLADSLATWRVPSITLTGCTSALAVTRHILGDGDGALEVARIGADAEDEWWRPSLASNSLGLAFAGLGDFREAGHRLSASVRNATTWGVTLWLNEALLFTGVVAFLAGDAERASRLMAAGRHLGGAPQMATPFRTAHSYALYLHYVPLAREALGPQAAHRTRAEGRAMSIEEASAYALEGLDG